jgi:hypothetical protein
MASDRNLILGAAAAAPKFNTGFANIVDKEVKEFTDRVEKEAKEKKARAEAISLDTANFLESLPENPTVELLDRSLKPAVESFLAQKRMELAGLYRTRRGDTATYAPGTEAYNKITQQIETGTRAINNVLNQLKIHQANKADYSQEQNSISQHWKEENLDMFADMKNIYLDTNYGTTIDAEGNITINGKYKINDWGSGENIKKLDWNVKENKYSIIYANVMSDTKNRNKTRKISENDGEGLAVNTQLKNYFYQQPDGGRDAITSLVMDNPNVEGFNILQAEDNIEGLRNLIKQGKYNDAIESVARSNALRIIKEQNNEYDASNAPSGNTYSAGDQFDLDAYSGTVKDALAFINSSPDENAIKRLIGQTNVKESAKYATGAEIIKRFGEDGAEKVGITKEDSKKLYYAAIDGQGGTTYRPIPLDISNQGALYDFYMNAYNVPPAIASIYKNRFNFGTIEPANNNTNPLRNPINITDQELGQVNEFLETMGNNLNNVNRTGIPRTDEELYEEF